MHSDRFSVRRGSPAIERISSLLCLLLVLAIGPAPAGAVETPPPSPPPAQEYVDSPITLVWSVVGSEDGIAVGDGLVLIQNINAYLVDYTLSPLYSLASPGFAEALGEAPTITEVALAPLTPNPNHGMASIAFALPHAMQVHLAVFDLQGRQLDVIADGRFEAGPHSLIWRASERGGRAAGVYFVQMTTPDRVINRRMVVAQ